MRGSGQYWEDSETDRIDGAVMKHEQIIANYGLTLDAVCGGVNCSPDYLAALAMDKELLFIWAVVGLAAHAGTINIMQLRQGVPTWLVDAKNGEKKSSELSPKPDDSPASSLDALVEALSRQAIAINSLALSCYQIAEVLHEQARDEDNEEPQTYLDGSPREVF